MFLVLVSVFAFTLGVNAASSNEATLHFVTDIHSGTITTGYVEYPDVGKIELYKNDTLVTDLSDNMKIDLNNANYKLKITMYPDSSVVPMKVRLNINNWYYSTIDEYFTIDTTKFYDKLDIYLVRKGTVVNEKIRNNFTNVSASATIDLTKDYVIDLTEQDDLTTVLRGFIDDNNTLYFKENNGSLVATENIDEAIIKVVLNKNENKAIMSAINADNKKGGHYTGTRVNYTGTKLTYTGEVDGIIEEIRDEYYTIGNYDFVIKFPKVAIVYNFIEGMNQAYTINKSGDLTFKIDASYDLFKDGGKVYVDNVLIDPNNYTSKKGSTVITLKDSYIKNLSIGEHTLKVVFNDGNEATTKFNVISETSTSTEVNPKTGDNVMTNILLLGTSFVVLTSSIIILKKKYSN